MLEFEEWKGVKEKRMKVPEEKRRRALLNKLCTDDMERFLNNDAAIYKKWYCKKKKAITKKNSYSK